MRNVLFISECTGITGGARQFMALAQGLRAKGWDVTIACPSRGETFRAAEDMGLPALDFSPRQDYDVLSAVRLSRLVAGKGIDILHAHHSRAHAVGLIAEHLPKRAPVFVVTRRVSFPPAGNIFSRLKYRNPRIDAFIAVADSVRRTLIEGGVPPEKVVVIPSGVDLERFSPRPKDAQWTRRLRLPEGVPAAGLVAHHGSWKGQDVFLRAAGVLKKRGARAVYILAGRETDCAEVRDMASAAGLDEDDARFLGFQEDIPGILSVLDVSVSASTSGEGLSGALRESLAMEIPVIASDVGGNRELVEDGRTGILFNPGDADALADALARTFADPARARRTAAAGRADVRLRLGVDRMVESTADLYDSLLRRGTWNAQLLQSVA